MRKSNLKFLALRLCSLFILSLFPMVSVAAIVTVDKDMIRYRVDTQKMQAEVYGLSNSSASVHNLVLPDFLEYNGKQVPVTSICNNAFYGKPLTGSLTIGNQIKTIGYRAFYQCTGLTGSLTIGDSVTSIGEYAFFECSGFSGSLTIGNSLKKIEKYTFCDCHGFTGPLVIGKSVQSIGEFAFADCWNMTGSLIIPNSVEPIDRCAFMDCNDLTGELVIPASVTSIGDDCFDSCNKISSLTISSSNTQINYFAFTRTGIQTVTCLGTTPPPCIYQENKDYIFSKEVYSKPLYVPKESINLYRTATEWKKFENISQLPIKATGIEIDKHDLSLFVGNEVTLKATLTPEDTTDKIEWSVNDGSQNVISVDQNGRVKALEVGSAVITISAGSVSTTCYVTVMPIVVTSISLNRQTIDAEIGAEYQLVASVLPADATNKDVEWATSDDKVATVNNTGLVNILDKGLCIITATTTDGSNLSATCRIDVSSAVNGINNDSNSKESVVTDNGTIRILNKGSETIVKIYSMQGALIKETIQDVIKGFPSGLYIVTAGTNCYKIKL